jgi:hypothetical protein
MIKTVDRLSMTLLDTLTFPLVLLAVKRADEKQTALAVA